MEVGREASASAACRGLDMRLYLHPIVYVCRNLVESSVRPTTCGAAPVRRLTRGGRQRRLLEHLRSRLMRMG